MGYSTEFDGIFKLSKPLDDELYSKLTSLDGPFDERDMPSQWNHWCVGEDMESIQWDGSEKFYGFIGWIRYINASFLRPANVALDGTVRFRGEDKEDSGRIVAESGNIRVFWNDDDPMVSNFDPNSKCAGYIPEGQGVSWIDRKRSIFVDVRRVGEMTESELQIEHAKLLGITIGNDKAVALVLDPCAVAGTNKPWVVGGIRTDSPRVRIVSLDMAMPMVDEERGACARLQSLCGVSAK